MKTYKNLYPNIVDFSNLYDAWRKARKGKRYKLSSAKFEQNLDYELLNLHDVLKNETYTPGDYVHFQVHDPKRRLISAAPFRDRVIHHALCNYIEPIFDRKFIFDTYANRIGKGTHAALDRCTHFMRRNKYVLQCDIQQFFPAIDHIILKQILAKTIACTSTFQLCSRIINSGAGILDSQYEMKWFEGDNLFACNRLRGLPIGNLTSQFWANVYLNELDQFVKHHLKVKGYLRYVDDFLLFSDSKKELHEWKSQIIHFLSSLRLTIHQNKAQVRPVACGITFLGFVVFPNYRRLKKIKGIRYQRHLKNLHRDVLAELTDPCEFQASLSSWIGHVKHGDTWGLRNAIFAKLKF